MQDSLFSGQKPEPTETVAEVNEELLQRAKRLPEFKERIFIFGEGKTGTKAAVVGESPGPPDIESGRPFMGPAGQMLERILSSIGLARSDCYLTNVIKVISQGDEITPEWLPSSRPTSTASWRRGGASSSPSATSRRARCSAPKSRSRSCAASSTTTTARPSCRPSTPPTSC